MEEPLPNWIDEEINNVRTETPSSYQPMPKERVRVYDDTREKMKIKSRLKERLERSKIMAENAKNLVIKTFITGALIICGTYAGMVGINMAVNKDLENQNPDPTQNKDPELEGHMASHPTGVTHIVGSEADGTARYLSDEEYAEYLADKALADAETNMADYPSKTR